MQKNTLAWQKLSAWGVRQLRRLLLLVFSAWLTFLLADFLFPLPTFKANQGFAQVITDRNGVPLRVFADEQGVWRYPTSKTLVSPYYLEALLGYEDRWFYQHPGVNPLALGRAVWQWMYYGRPVSGGSTLTMQVARLLDPHEKTLAGKAKQMFRALQLEWHFSKDEILNLYLNHAPFGGTLEGVEAASYAYLGKSSRDLTRAEAALLAVLPQSPSRLRPDRYPSRAQDARNKVLSRLADNQTWSPSEVADARLESVVAYYHGTPMTAPLLARRLHQEQPHQQVIKTTLDAELQLSLEQLLNDYIAAFPQGTSAAALVVDNRDMSALAYLGSADFANQSRFGHIDMINAYRSPGSTLKPLLFGLSLDQGIIHEQSMLLDVPADFNGYRPDNFVKGYSGLVSARQALQRSLNIPAVQLLQQLTPDVFYARLAQVGVTLSLPEGATPNLAMILGGVSSSMEDLVTGFAVFGRNGKTRPIRFTQDAPIAVERPLISDGAAWVTANVLREVSLSEADTQLATRVDQNIAFKTGTSYGYRDAWVLASSKNITIGVWVGRPDGTPLAGNFGRNTAVPLLKIILELMPDHLLEVPERPSSIERNKVCWPLGTLQSQQQSHWCYQTKTAWLIDNVAPPSIKDPFLTQWGSYLTQVDVDQEGHRVNPTCGVTAKRHAIAVWPLAAEPWLPKAWHRDALLPKWAKTCTPSGNDVRLKIVGLQSKTELYTSTEAPLLLNLDVLGAQGDVHWFHNGHWIGASTKPYKRALTISSVGPQRLTVMDARGLTETIEFQVLNQGG
ncbi:penicillin-binding protein 1C [Pleionea litopenaei]|uniref:peptidoglycan glycosyltransferase n=1 Tax=Pleionea litopenaei TaxID=3070815 RepID=A0AA51X5E1_9GAMM|nr:penicillin-binding protein 1C [Pleionea sp. HL-JVS1]WMS85972.1 penicillin-binding protein 1C [Pleionea sp. HL-JVS1]